MAEQTIHDFCRGVRMDDLCRYEDQDDRGDDEPEDAWDMTEAEEQEIYQRITDDLARDEGTVRR